MKTPSYTRIIAVIFAITIALAFITILYGCAPTPTTPPIAVEAPDGKWDYDYGRVNRIVDEENGVVCYVLVVTRAVEMECFTQEELNSGR